MKRIGKFPIVITTKVGENTSEIQKTRTVYSNDNRLVMFYKGEYITVTTNNGDEYFALYEPKQEVIPESVVNAN